MTKVDSSIPGAEGLELHELYARRFAGHGQRRSEVWVTLIQSYFQKWINAQDTVLDLGAGYCEFINSVQAKIKLALDLNPTTSECAAQDVEVISQNLAHLWNIPSASVNVVFTSNFFEHLASKEQLSHCLRETFRVLVPGGRLIALGPNIRYAYNVYWDFFDHSLPLSDRSLVEALELNGFKPQVVIPRFLPYSMTGRIPAHPLLVRLYLAIPIAWRFLGKQFLVIAAK